MLDSTLPQAFWIVLLLSAIPLGASALVGLLISVLQSATQIQEQTIVYVAKFLTLCLVLGMCGSWIKSELLQFMQQMFGVALLVART